MDYRGTVEELAESLTMLGLEVEGIERFTAPFQNIVVAQIEANAQHPDADRLSVAQVQDGQGTRQIVCGAKNYKVGDKVPLALPGAVIPGEKPFTIKVGKLRGVESQGMMCAAAELGLSSDAEGLMILPEDAQVGQPLAEHLGLDSDDAVLDLEVTPNRPDLNSFLGIAREIAALQGSEVRLPEGTDSLPEGPESVQSQVEVRLHAPELCPRYTARVIHGVRVGPSPSWLKRSLERVGLRSINNVVDVTNYVLFETGHPLHAFDLNLLNRDASGKATIVVRRAAEGEMFTTLDDQKHQLQEDMLLIADTQRGVALAGVMGGKNSEIQEETTSVLLESAWFDPKSIRATSKRLDLRTDASYRFERGADIGMCDWASRRAAQLILETAGGVLCEGVVDAYPEVVLSREVTLRFERTEALLGMKVPAERQETWLTRLGFDRVGGEEGVSATFQIPTWRVDIKREADLIEEVVRLEGVDKVPSTPPRGAFGSHPHDAIHDDLAEVRRILLGAGLYEAQGQTLISGADAAETMGMAPEGAEIARLSHPLSQDMDVLRPSLLPCLLASLRHNASHGVESAALFEVGRVFLKDSEGFREHRRVALALMGLRNDRFWQGGPGEAAYDVLDLKGMLELLLERLGLRGVQFQRRPEPSGCFVESATLTMGRNVVGELGQLHPVKARKLDLRSKVFLAELDLDLFLARRSTKKTLAPLAAFPSSRRDVAMVVADAVTHDEVLKAIRKAKADLLEEVRLFDEFRGGNVPQGSRSLAYALVYRHAARTLKDEEVQAQHDKVLQNLAKEVGAVFR